MDITLDGIKDFGERCHTVSREPYFYDAGYTYDYLPLTKYSHGMLPDSKNSRNTVRKGKLLDLLGAVQLVVGSSQKVQ